MAKELKPCPFCGGEAKHKHIFQNPDKCMVGCSRCDAGIDGVFENEAEATEYWNYRTPANVAPVVHGRWIERNQNSADVICSECNTLETNRDSNYKSCFCPSCGAKMDGQEAKEGKG